MAHLVISLLLALAAAGAQATVPYEKLRQVGDLVTCQCGCAYTVGSCNMLNCHFRDPVLQDIQAGLEAGQPDGDVLEAVYAKYGSETRVQPPDDGFGLIGWIAPFATLLAGLALVPWVIRRWRRSSHARSRATGVPDEVVDRFRSRIEDDLEELE